jgi:tetratricopeptide (TPR) repeat protein
MRTRISTILALLVSTPCFAMGGGGMHGGYGSGLHSSSGFDDYSTAIRLIHHEQYLDAVPYLDRALQEKPGNADVLNYLGYTHRMLGDYPGSLDFYQQALAHNPDHRGAHEYLGELYLKMNRLADAQVQLAELTRLCTDGCDEKDVLTKAIADYQLAAATPAAPAAQPAAAAASASTQPAAAAAPSQSAAPAQSAVSTSGSP